MSLPMLAGGGGREDDLELTFPLGFSRARGSYDRTAVGEVGLEVEDVEFEMRCPGRDGRDEEVEDFG
jgi:hypothetical protein